MVQEPGTSPGVNEAYERCWRWLGENVERVRQGEFAKLPEDVLDMVVRLASAMPTPEEARESEMLAILADWRSGNLGSLYGVQDAERGPSLGSLASDALRASGAQERWSELLPSMRSREIWPYLRDGRAAYFGVLALEQAQAGDVDGAIERYQEGLEVAQEIGAQPEAMSLAFGLAKLLLDNDRTQAREAVARVSSELSSAGPADVVGWASLVGRMYEDLGEPEQAEREYRRGVETFMSLPNDEAKRAYEDALLVPEAALARLLRRTERGEEVDNILERLTEKVGGLASGSLVEPAPARASGLCHLPLPGRFIHGSMNFSNIGSNTSGDPVSPIKSLAVFLPALQITCKTQHPKRC